MGLLLSGGWTSYTMGEVRLGVPESVSREKKVAGGQQIRGCAARVVEEQPGVRHTRQRAGSSTCPGEECEKGRQQQQSARCDRLNECSRALHGRPQAVPRAQGLHNWPEGSTTKQRAAGGLDVCTTIGRDLW
jgi:hypothetical protein